MIKILGQIPRYIHIAVSGGSDSMACLEFLRNSNRNISAIFFDHGTAESAAGRALVKRYCYHNDIPCIMGHIQRFKKKNESWEEYWRNERYNFFSSYHVPTITCHHLDDCVEEYLINTIKRGRLGTINDQVFYHRTLILRPFLLNRKQILIDFCDKHNIEYITSGGNDLRSKIRSSLIPTIIKDINPGIHKLVKKMILDRDKQQSCLASTINSCT